MTSNPDDKTAQMPAVPASTPTGQPPAGASAPPIIPRTAPQPPQAPQAAQSTTSATPRMVPLKHFRLLCVGLGLLFIYLLISEMNTAKAFNAAGIEYSPLTLTSLMGWLGRLVSGPVFPWLIIVCILVGFTLDQVRKRRVSVNSANPQ